MSRPTLLPNRLSLENLRGDLFGGVTAGIVALPLALAFGVASGMENGAAAGLYGAILVGFFAALFGGTPAQVSGPTGPITVVVAGLLTAAEAGEGPSPLTTGMLAFTVLLAGLLQIGFGFAGLGSLIRFVPSPVISGFMTGIGAIIILIQLAPLVGLPGPSNPLAAVRGLPDLAPRANLQALALGVGAIVLVYLTPRVIRGLPGTLVALLAGTLAAALLQLDVPTIGEIPRGLPSFALEMPDFRHIRVAVLGALTIAILGSIDSLLTSVVADNITRTRHSSNQELVGQGLGNAIAGMFGSLPGAGATMRTVINFRSGGRTPLAGMVHALVLLAVLVALAPVASRIPLPVLAGILITVGISIVDYRGLRHLPRAPRADAAVLLLVMFLTIFVDLMQAVGFGVVLACLLFVKRLGDLNLGRYVPLEESSGPWTDEAALPEDFLQRVYVYHAEGPFFFGSARDLVDAVEATGLEKVEAVIIRTKFVPLIDQSGAYALEDLIRSMADRNVPVLVSGLHPEPRDLLERLHIIGTILPPAHVFADFDDAVRYLRENLASLRGTPSP